MTDLYSMASFIVLIYQMSLCCSDVARKRVVADNENGKNARAPLPFDVLKAQYSSYPRTRYLPSNRIG